MNDEEKTSSKKKNKSKKLKAPSERETLSKEQAEALKQLQEDPDLLELVQLNQGFAQLISKLLDIVLDLKNRIKKLEGEEK